MTQMNSRDRVFAALKGSIPDRVPVMELFIDPKVINSISQGMSYKDFIDYADMDVVTCLTMADEPGNINWIDEEKHIFRDKWGALQKFTEEVLAVPITPARIETETDLQSYQPPNPSEASVFEYARKLIKRFKGKRGYRSCW